MLNSPYTPGAGHSPEVLAGRDRLIAGWNSMLAEVQTGGRVRSESTLLTGPRGIGKTALLSEFHRAATARGYEVIVLQAVAGRGSLIDGLMARADKRVRESSAVWGRVKDVFERIGGIQLGVAGISAGANFSPGPDRPLPDAGLFADGLAALAESARVEGGRGGGLLFSIDELQVTDPADLALLAATLHRLNVEHPTSPVVFAATGLPNTMDALEAAEVTHPHRLFRERKIALQLERGDARYAIIQPGLNHGVAWESDAVDLTVDAANRYPAHLQTIADLVWQGAPGPDRVLLADVEQTLPAARQEIEERTLDPRWNDVTDRQAEFLAALAVNGGEATSRQLIATLKRPQSDWSGTRADLIAAGDIYPPGRAQLAFAVPTLTEYVLANYPDRVDVASVPLLTLPELQAGMK